ncbi:hypothetical protein GF373_06595 [bacterium]|nr:hypothetical protein [bacterium]
MKQSTFLLKALCTCLALVFGFGMLAQAQDVTMFFPSTELEPTVDEHGNEYVTTPADAVIPFPENFGETPEPVIEGLVVDPAYIYESFTDDQGNTYTTVAADDSLAAEDVFTEENLVDDNLWVLRGAAMPDMGVLASRAPAETEDAPQLKTTVTMAEAGTYNVFLWYGDIGAANPDDDANNPTPIDAGLEGEDMQTFFQADGVLVTDEYGWNVLEAQVGTVTVDANGSFSVLIDDHVGEGARTAYLGLRISEGELYDPPEPITYDFHDDNKWMIYPVAGRELLISHGPGLSGEDAPQLTTEITLAHAGTYEVIFHFMDSNDFPDEGWIAGQLNDGPVENYGAGHPDAVRASGGTAPGYPWIDNNYHSSMFWYTASMGEVTVEAGESITIKADDFQFTSGAEYMASVFEGITLKVIEGGPPITEIQVSPAFRYEWGEDPRGNRYQTTAADESLAADAVFTETDSGGDSLWRVRDLGIYGWVYESRGPTGSEDCPRLETTVEVANGGTYEVFILFGDIGQVGNDDENNPTPINVGFEGEDLKTYYPWDAEFIGLWGFNIMEASMGTITVEDGGQVNVLIDDVEEIEGGDRRSVYAGLRFELADDANVADWSLF